MPQADAPVKCSAGPVPSSLGGVAEAVVAVPLLVDEKEEQPLAGARARLGIGLGGERAPTLALVDPDFEGAHVSAQALALDVPDRAVFRGFDLLQEMEQGLVSGRDHLAQGLVRLPVADVDASQDRKSTR